MSLLQKHILHIRNPNYNVDDICIDLHHSTKILEHNSQKSLFTLLSKYKKHIDLEPEWNHIKKITNLF